jgi:transcriptional regulator with XRE-family HTH domain
MKSKDLRKKLLEKSEGFRRLYFKRNLPLEISHMIIRERVSRGLTQAQLAELVGTKQSGIARTERGTTYPDIDFLERIADKLGMHLLIELQNDKTQTKTKTWANAVESDKMQIIKSPSPYFSSNDFSENLPPTEDVFRMEE